MQGAVLITGATSGFGAASARCLARQGWPLILCGRRLERLQALADELSELTSVLPLQLDVREAIAVQRAIDELPEPFSGIQVLVNNAGLTRDQLDLCDPPTIETALEAIGAEVVVNAGPCAEQVRFTTSGTDAAASAIMRIAR